VRILKEKNLLGAIEDETGSDTKDDQAFTIITLNIKDSQIPYIQDARTTKEAWTALKEVQQGIGMNGRMVLMQPLWALKMGEGDDMAQHLNQFRELANQLRSMSVKGKGMDDSELVTSLTLGLPGSYELWVMGLQSRSDTITFDMKAGRLLQESGRRQISHATHTHDGTNLPPHTAFTVQRGSRVPTHNRGGGAFGNYSRGRGGSRNKGQGTVNHNTGWKDTSQAIRSVAPGTQCHYCRKSGPLKRDCYKRKADEAAGGGTAHTGNLHFLRIADNLEPEMAGL